MRGYSGMVSAYVKGGREETSALLKNLKVLTFPFFIFFSFPSLFLHFILLSLHLPFFLFSSILAAFLPSFYSPFLAAFRSGWELGWLRKFDRDSVSDMWLRALVAPPAWIVRSIICPCITFCRLCAHYNPAAVSLLCLYVKPRRAFLFQLDHDPRFGAWGATRRAGDHRQPDSAVSGPWGAWRADRRPWSRPQEDGEPLPAQISSS